MTEADLKVFINGAESYFDTVSNIAATVDTPFVKEQADRIIYDFASVIGVSGSQRGCVYYSAPRSMVQELVSHVGETSFEDGILADYVGEIANTIAGNARKTLGPRFMISVPVTFHPAGNQEVRFPRDIPAFVIPLVWRDHKSSLIICLEARDDETGEPDLVLTGDAVEGED